MVYKQKKSQSGDYMKTCLMLTVTVTNATHSFDEFVS
jgi:hypothetical protein